MGNRVIKREWLHNDIDLDYNMQPIEVFEEMLIRFKKLGASHIDIIVDKDWDGDVNIIQYQPYKCYMETDEQLKTRKKREEERKTLLENRELAELKRLKEKYN